MLGELDSRLSRLLLDQPEQCQTVCFEWVFLRWRCTKLLCYESRDLLREFFKVGVLQTVVTTNICGHVFDVRLVRIERDFASPYSSVTFGFHFETS